MGARAWVPGGPMVFLSWAGRGREVSLVSVARRGDLWPALGRGWTLLICCLERGAAFPGSVPPDGLNLVGKTTEDLQGLRREWFGTDFWGACQSYRAIL